MYVPQNKRRVELKTQGGMQGRPETVNKWKNADETLGKEKKRRKTGIPPGWPK